MESALGPPPRSAVGSRVSERVGARVRAVRERGRLPSNGVIIEHLGKAPVGLIRCQRKMSRGKCSDTSQLGASTISLMRKLAAVLHNRYASAGSSARFAASHSIM